MTDFDLIYCVRQYQYCFGMVSMKKQGGKVIDR